MSIRSFAPVALSLLAASCGSTPTMQLDLSSDPVGAQVYMSRRGEKAYQGNLGPISGNVKGEELVEGFTLIGTSPLRYETPLKETESDATVLGVGGKVVLKYKEAVVRFEKPGFETVERHVRFKDGKLEVYAQMPQAVAVAAQ